MHFRISVEQPRAYLDPSDAELLDGVLAIRDPDADKSKAYQEGRWDGYVRLYHANGSFSSGHVHRVVEEIHAHGHSVDVFHTPPLPPLDLSRMRADYLHGKVLRDYQFEAWQTLIRAGGGICKIATGGGKTQIEAAIARYIWEETGGRVIVIVPKAGLAVQTAHEFHAMYGGEVSLGLLTQGKRDIGDVTIATYQTLAGCMVRNVKRRQGNRTVVVPKPAEPALDELVRTAVCIIVDEHHHGSATTIQAIGDKASAPFRFGFSATPLKYSELADARVIGMAGPVVYDVSAVELISAGYLSRPLIAAVCHPHVSGPPLGNKLWYAHAYRRGIVENPHHNAAVLRAVEWILARGRQVLILCRQKAQFVTLRSGLDVLGIPHHAVWGATETPERTLAKRAFGDGAVRVLLGSEVLGEGEDIRNVEAVVLAEGVKVNTNVLQRIGRGMRLKPQCGNTVWVVDFIPTNHRKLFDHGLARVRHYESEGHEVRPVETWPKLVSTDYLWPDLLPFAQWNTP